MHTSNNVWVIYKPGSFHALNYKPGSKRLHQHNSPYKPGSNVEILTNPDHFPLQTRIIFKCLILIGRLIRGASQVQTTWYLGPKCFDWLRLSHVTLVTKSWLGLFCAQNVIEKTEILSWAQNGNSILGTKSVTTGTNNVGPTTNNVGPTTNNVGPTTNNVGPKNVI